MISIIIRYITAIGILMFAAGCSDDTFSSENGLVAGAPGTVTIRFVNSKSSSRVGDDDSENTNPETIIRTLVIGFYKESAEETIPAVTVTKFTELSAEDEYTAVIELNRVMVREIFDNTDGQLCRVYAVANLPVETVDGLGSPTISELKGLTVTTAFDEEKMPSSFVMTGESKVKYTAVTAVNDPGSAATVDHAPISLQRAAAKICLNLRLPDSLTPQGSTEEWEPVTDNMMCMLSNGVKISVASPDQAEDGTGWKPESETAYFNGTLRDANGYRTFEDDGTTGDDAYPYVMDVPFYTYPNSWEETDEETHKTVMTLIVPWKLKSSDNDSRRNYYYQVPVTRVELTQLDRNHSYTVNLNVGMLGSLDPDRPLPVEEFSYQIVNWGQEDIDVDMNDYRYLVVNPNVYTVHNAEEIMIPFYSSHPVTLGNVSVTFERFAFVANGMYPDVGKVVRFTINQEQIEWTNSNTVDNPDGKKIITWRLADESQSSNKNSIIIDHPLTIWNPIQYDEEYYPGMDEPEISRSNLDFYSLRRESASEAAVKKFADLISYYVPADYPAYSPYIIKIHIEHTDNANFSEDVIINQYPEMYIEADPNPTPILTEELKKNPDGTLAHPTNQPVPIGNVYVNGQWDVPESSDENSLGTIKGIFANGEEGSLLTGGSRDKNPNMYIVTTTQLSPGSTYIIGDPRSSYYTNDLSGNGDLPTPTSNGAEAGVWCELAPALYPGTSEKRRLTYYYPTIETDATKNMIAPRFRVCSSWGIASWQFITSRENAAKTRELARRRAATYQEQGCPAGRWRLPTFAEFSYIVQLSIDKKIPELYTPNLGYWTAQGIAYFAVNNGVANIYLDGEPPNIQYSVRPIYDEWYWSQYSAPYSVLSNKPYEYTLGDIPRGMKL